MFLIRSIGCRAIYLTPMLCVMVNIIALCRKFSKESLHFSLSWTTICPSGRVPTDQKIRSDCQRRKEQLQTVKICIQNAVPARLVCCQHRIQELIELAMISKIPLAKPPNILAANKIHNSISFLRTLKVFPRRLKSWLFINLTRAACKQTSISKSAIQRSSYHQATSTLLATFHRLKFSILRNQWPCLLD